MTSPARGYALWQAVNYVVDNNIQGAFVECGVWRGGSSMLMALTLKARGAVNRPIFMFDTFNGMTPPTGDDTDIHGRTADELMKGALGDRISELVIAKAGIEEVQKNMESVGYNRGLLHYVCGDIKETAPKTQTLHIALLRLDTDFYDSTLCELQHLYPRVRKGAPIIIDDYGHWQGARKAFNDYFSTQETKPFLWAIDYTGRGFTKPEKEKEPGIERYDYVPEGMEDADLLHLFPHATVKNPWTIKWEYLRPYVPHIYRVDSRIKQPIGYASYEEATCLYNLARPFAGKMGLEIGTHFGWTAAHLRKANLELDCVDPAFQDPERLQAVSEVFDQIPSDRPYRLHAMHSPECLQGLNTKWSFIFIDGYHEGLAPENDAKGVIGLCEEDAMVVFHDMFSPHVARGLAVFKEAGWNVRLFHTMQIIGVAWRGNVEVPEHIQDPNVRPPFVGHLNGF